MAKYEISDFTYKILYRYFVDRGSEITYKEGLAIADELKKLKQKTSKTAEIVEKVSKTKENKDNRVYFDVFYGDKIEAKNLGAKWDKDLKLWYAEEGTEVCDKMRMVFEVKELESKHRKQIIK